jgi:RND family efflux transporter MFP subunit
MTTDKQPRLQETENNSTGKPPRPMQRIIFCTLILLAGAALFWYLLHTRPTVIRQPPAKKKPSLVSVVPLHSRSEIITITAMGTVIPSREIVLKTPVAGEIIAVNEAFTTGGLLEEGATILRIDPTDYELAVEQKQRDLSEAEFAYRLEQGHQDVAMREWSLLYGEDGGDELESTLALRKPHLEKVEVDIRAARAELEQAKINLARTVVRAPFNALVLNKKVDRGSFVASQEELAHLIGTDEYWVQVSLPLDRLRWLQTPRGDGEPGSPAKVYYRQSNVRYGQVTRLMGDLSAEGRMARLLISVSDPLGLRENGEGKPRLILGEYVRVEIEGDEVQDVFRIPRTALRNDREIWLAGEDGRLAIRPVRTIWRDEENVLIRDGLRSGDLLIVSDLPAPVDGMRVRLDRDEGADGGAAGRLPAAAGQAQ